MHIEVVVNLSKRVMDQLIRAIDDSCKRIIIDEWTIDIELGDTSPENISAWMSEERKLEFKKHMDEQFPEYQFEVVSIKLNI